MKQSATLPLREPKARFTGRSPASFLMRVSALHFQNKKSTSYEVLFCFEADTRIRTGDLILTKDALYLLSYISKAGDLKGARTPDLQRDRLAF